MKTFIVTIEDEEMKEWREYMNEDGAIEAEKSDEYAIKAALEFHELSCKVEPTTAFMNKLATALNSIEFTDHPRPTILEDNSREQNAEDHSDDICPCGDPDCSRPFGHAEE